MTGRYKMSTVCRRTGFNQAILRAWERRYGLLRPERTGGGHRLYTDEDLHVLGRVRELLEAGHTIGEIATAGRDALLEPAPSAPSQGGGAAELERAVPEATGEPGPGDAAGGELAARVARLALAAARIDAPAVESGLDAAFAALSPLAALDRIVLPALVEVGVLWNAGRCSTAGEHLLSSKVVGRLHALLRTANPLNTAATHAVCACLPDEEHEIGALFSAYSLARHGCRVTYLGARLPFEALEQAAEALRPNLLCLSVARPDLLREQRARLMTIARRVPAGVRLVLGGGGVQAEDAELEALGVIVVRAGGPRLVELLG